MISLCIKSYKKKQPQTELTRLSQSESFETNFWPCLLNFWHRWTLLDVGHCWLEYITKTGFLMQMHWSQFLLWEWLIVAISLRLSFAESKVDSEAEAMTKWESRFYKNVRIQLDLPPSSPKTLLSSIVLICSGKGDVDQNVISIYLLLILDSWQ